MQYVDKICWNGLLFYISAQRKCMGEKKQKAWFHTQTLYSIFRVSKFLCMDFSKEKWVKVNMQFLSRIYQVFAQFSPLLFIQINGSINLKSNVNNGLIDWNKKRMQYHWSVTLNHQQSNLNLVIHLFEERKIHSSCWILTTVYPASFIVMKVRWET